MLHLPQHQALRDLQTIYLEHLVPRRALELATREAVALAGMDEAGAEGHYWDLLWAALYRERPDLFPRRLGWERTHGTALAFLYAVTQRAPGFTRFELPSDEARLLRAGRSQLRAWSGLRSFERSCELLAFDERCVALRGAGALRGREFIALSLHAVARHSRHVLVDQQQLRLWRETSASQAAIAALVLHEEAHVALAVHYGLPKGQLIARRRKSALASWVDEAVASLIECAAHYYLHFGSEPGWREIAHNAGGYTHPRGIRQLLRLSPQSATTHAILRNAIQAAHLAMNEDEDSLAAYLNSKTGRTRTAARWLSALSVK